MGKFELVIQRRWEKQQWAEKEMEYELHIFNGSNMNLVHMTQTYFSSFDLE